MTSSLLVVQMGQATSTLRQTVTRVGHALNKVPSHCGLDFACTKLVLSSSPPLNERVAVFRVPSGATHPSWAVKLFGPPLTTLAQAPPGSSSLPPPSTSTEF
mmetsp:Transcript_21322/g.64151  ORF Transcript_21322/g.64151 Transcript_21322/m.64151 type:complete len:102 (-) Transcript_21322:239-544(-)